MRKIYANVTARVVLSIDDGTNIESIKEELEIVSDPELAIVEDSEIISMEVTDSK